MTGEVQNYVLTLFEELTQLPMSGNAATTAPATGPLGPAGEIQPMPPGTNVFTDPNLLAVVQNASGNYGVDPNLVLAVIRQESGGNPNAVSPAGAEGLMQLMPTTAATLGVSNPLDPVQNIEGGVKYLAGLLRAYGGNVSLALAAYNAGPGAVSAYGGIPPYPETQSYVREVLASYQALSGA